VVIIYDAHTLNPSAGNALLKMLEEPPERTFLILIAPQATDLLPTIVSRCQLIRFNPIRRRSIRDKLQAEGLAEDQARIMAILANGSLKRALEMLRSGWIQRRSVLLAAGGLDDAADAFARTSRQALAVAEALANDKNNLDDALTTVSYWLRDLMVFKFDSTRIVNKDLIDKIEKVAQNVPTASLLDGIETVRQAQRKIAANANLRLTLEVMMLQLTDILNRSPGQGAMV
jgi:DNA polymerase-3 subunit delta'